MTTTMTPAGQVEKALANRRRGPGIRAVPAPADESPWMDAEQASTYSGFTTGALKKMRYLGEGPAFSKPNGRVRYHRDDLDAFLGSGRRSS